MMDENLKKPTTVLNKYESDDFLDFDSSDELELVMGILNKIMLE
jgi:hypothetical protein